MKKNILFLCIVSIFLLTLFTININAATDDKVFQQNQNINLVVPCINNGTVCSNSADCRLTFQYQNGSYIVNYQSMTMNNGDANYTIPSSSLLGIYPTKVSCCDGSLCGTSTFNTVITSGDIVFYIVITIIVLAILLIGIFAKIIPLTMIGALCTVAWGVYTGLNGFDSFKNLGTEIFSIAILAFGIFWGFMAMADYLDLLD